MMTLGAQLYTLRSYTQNEEDLAYCLKKVAEIGYTTVQISAVGPIPAETIRELCDKNNLKIVLTHTDVNRIQRDTDAVIREHEIMGCPYIGIGYMPDKYHNGEWITHFAPDFKETAKKIAASGKLLMYHNHDFEFRKIPELSGKRILEYLMENFGPDELGFTLDTYWVQAAGGDVVEWIDALKGRLPCVHLKDMAMEKNGQVMAPVMEGNMNFPRILRHLEKAGTKYILVEQDTCLESPFLCLEKSYRNVSSLGYR